MKKIITLIILVLLTSCSIYSNDKNEKDIFQKKLECSKLIDSEKKWLKEFTNMDYNSSGKLVNNVGEIGIEKKNSEVLGVFYSKSISSCVSIIKISYNVDMSYSYRYIIRDVLENKSIGDYYNWDYYDSLINQYGDGKFDWTEKNYPSLCEKDSQINHCIEYYKKLKQLGIDLD